MQLLGEQLDPRFEQRRREPGLDLLRAIAIIIVVLYHGGIFGFTLPGRIHRFGWVGVDLFFVLSGYLIGGQLLAQIARSGRVGFSRFYSRRALRILPAYFVVLAVYFVFPVLREYPVISPLWKYLISVQNIGLRGGTAFSHAWSLAIEDQFYLVLPLMLPALVRSRRAAVIVPSVIVVAGVLLRAALGYSMPSPDGGVSFRGYQQWVYYATWTRLDPLVFGVALAGVRRYRPSLWDALARRFAWLWIPSLGAVAFGLYLGEGQILTVRACTWQLLLIAAGMAGLLICATSQRSPLSHKGVPGAAFFASVAYSVYLSHKLVIHAVAGQCERWGLALTSATAILFVQVAIYAVGAILFLAVERPFLRLRNRLNGY